MLLAEQGVPLKGFMIEDWPWFWVDLLGLVKWVKNVAERAAMSDNPKEAFPPRHVLFDRDYVDDWFKARKK